MSPHFSPQTLKEAVPALSAGASAGRLRMVVGGAALVTVAQQKRTTLP